MIGHNFSVTGTSVQICLTMIVFIAGGGAPPGLKLLVVDEIQAAYGKQKQLHELLEYTKDVACGQQLQGDTAGPARIVLASVHSDAPGLGPSKASGKELAMPFAYGPEHLVQLLATSDDGSLKYGELLRHAAAAVAAAKGTDEEVKEVIREFMKRHAPSVAFGTAEADTYWQRFWDDELRSTAFQMVGPSVQEHLLWVTSGQVSMVIMMWWHHRCYASALGCERLPRALWLCLHCCSPVLGGQTPAKLLL